MVQCTLATHLPWHKIPATACPAERDSLKIYMHRPPNTFNRSAAGRPGFGDLLYSATVSWGKAFWPWSGIRQYVGGKRESIPASLPNPPQSRSFLGESIWSVVVNPRVAGGKQFGGLLASPSVSWVVLVIVVFMVPLRICNLNSLNSLRPLEA